MPATSSPRSSSSPTWTPARAVSPIRRTDRRISAAAMSALTGPSKTARMPSPVDLTMRPPFRVTASPRDVVVGVHRRVPPLVADRP